MQHLRHSCLILLLGLALLALGCNSVRSKEQASLWRDVGSLSVSGEALEVFLSLRGSDVMISFSAPIELADTLHVAMLSDDGIRRPTSRVNNLGRMNIRYRTIDVAFAADKYTYFLVWSGDSIGALSVAGDGL
jgi:hypothetical protein